MVSGTIQIKGERFVILPESEYERMRELTHDIETGDGPRLPKANSKGQVPAVEYARASLARKLIRDRRRVGITQADFGSFGWDKSRNAVLNRKG